MVKGPGATTFLLVVDRSPIGPGVLSAAFLGSLGRQSQDYNRAGPARGRPMWLRSQAPGHKLTPPA